MVSWFPEAIADAVGFVMVLFLELEFFVATGPASVIRVPTVSMITTAVVGVSMSLLFIGLLDPPQIALAWLAFFQWRLTRSRIGAGQSPWLGRPAPSAPLQRPLRASLAASALLAACAGAPAPAACAIDADCGKAAFCSAGVCLEGTRACPTLQPRLSSIGRGLFQVGCGAKVRNCHAVDAAVVESGPSFAGDLHGALVQVPAANRLGSATGLVLVAPGDPDHSFLLTKLRLQSSSDLRYGPGQPATAPGSICEASLAVVAEWISRGALDD